MSALDEHHAASDSSGHIWAGLYTTAAVIKVLLLTVHSVKVYQDLFTKERKSVAHRRTAPTITKSYKLIAYLTLFSILMLTLSAISGAIQPVSSTDKQCSQFAICIVTFVQAGKTGMYMVFLARLYAIYERSAYSYPLKCIGCFAVTLIIYGLVVGAMIILLFSLKVYTYGHYDYPNWCGPGGNEFVIGAALIILEDLGAAVGFLWAFMIPLKKTLKAIDSADNDAKVTRKIIYAGTKTAILTGVATISTFLLLLGTAAITGAASIPDTAVNSICMMLMTAYYQDSKYYAKICCLCMKCCDKRGTSPELEQQMKNAANDRENEPTRTEIVSSATGASSATGGPSVDTMSQLRVAGNDTKIVYAQGNGGNETVEENQEVTPQPALEIADNE